MQPKVLVVEDRTVSRQGIVDVLERAGFSAVGVENGDEALAYLQAGFDVAVILLALLMPVMDGWRLRRAPLREPWLAELAVIVLSAIDGRALTGLSATAALKKPIDVHALIDAVRAVCA